MTDTGSMTARLVQYPSDELPGIPPFTVEVPDGWEVGQMPGTVFTTVASEWDGPFRPNVTINASVVGRDAPLDDLVQAYASDLANRAEVSVRSITPHEGDGSDGLQVELDVTFHGTGEAIVQRMVLLRVDTRPPASALADLFTITASLAADAPAEVSADQLAIVRSFEIS